MTFALLRSRVAGSRRTVLSRALATAAAAALPRHVFDPKDASANDTDYFPPPEANGGWRSLVVRDQVPSPSRKSDIRALAGLDWDRLHATYQWARGFSPETTLLVLRRGWIAGEWGPGSTHFVASVSKSLTALAFARMCFLSRDWRWGRVVEPSTPAWTALPSNFEQSDPRKRSIRLEHLSSMTSGLAPDDAPYAQTYTPDRVLCQPVLAPPGTVWSYCSASSDLLGMAVQTVTRRCLRDFFNQEIARPLGMSWTDWDFFGPYNRACCAARLNARDLARVAYLLLRRGRWRSVDGRLVQILDERLVDFLIRPSPVARSCAFRPTTNSPFPVPSDSQLNYGNGFWTNATRSTLGWAVPPDAFYAHGYGETLVVAVPSLDLVVVRYGWGTNVLPSLKRDLLARIVAAVV
ncbi:MAG: beta-lactamase family protein [Geminicoccaceae bacterium]|nr:beta-lactamase family protein [Geminicoccaceae bacterium]MCX7630379.1 beta-lactamase family protein [Geminicoccaceae bacterium]MDW8125231.1 serine hydrolase domain-containing protein [Geminicoccaceae bacterium]